MMAYGAYLALAAILLGKAETACLDDLLSDLPSPSNDVTPWLRVECRTGNPRVLRLSGSAWVEVPNARHAARLSDGSRALIDRESGYAIIDPQGNERARLPCASWMSGDRRRIYCLTALPPAEARPERRVLTRRVWSDEGAPLLQQTASLPPADRPGFLRFGEVRVIGLLGSGELAIEEVCLPQSGDVSAPRLGRLFALRGDKLVLLASAVDRPDGVSADIWRVRLPKGVWLQSGGRDLSRWNHPGN